MPDDIGRFVGRYLQALAALVVGAPVPEPSAALVALLGAVLLVTTVVPLVLLLSDRARMEFRAT